MREIKTTLKGMSYRLKPDTIRKIDALTPCKISIRREPTNINDHNAIAVYYLEPPFKGVHIGYVEKLVAAELAPRLDANEIEFVEGWLDEADEDGTGPMRMKFQRT